jgi:hypothetical protein
MAIRLACLLILMCGTFAPAWGDEAAKGVGNRLVYLDEFADPYYVGLETAKLITPQWVGEEGSRR